MSGSAQYLPLSSSLSQFLLLLSRSHGPSESSPSLDMLKMQHKNLEHDQPITSFSVILPLSPQEQLCICRYVVDGCVKTRVQVFIRPCCMFVPGFIRGRTHGSIDLTGLNCSIWLFICKTFGGSKMVSLCFPTILVCDTCFLSSPCRSFSSLSLHSSLKIVGGNALWSKAKSYLLSIDCIFLIIGSFLIFCLALVSTEKWWNHIPCCGTW